MAAIVDSSSGNKHQKLIVVGVYFKHQHIEETKDLLIFVMKNLNQYYEGIPIIVTGDFNMRRSEAQVLANMVNLQLVNNEDENMVTREQGD